jgi:hypothetical protein
MRFIEIITGTAFVDRAITIVVFAIADLRCGFDLSLAKSIPLAASIASLEAFFTFADRTATLSGCARFTCTTAIDHTIAVIVEIVAADLFFAIV